TYMGSTLGPMRGRDGNVHRGRPREGLLPMISHLGSLIPVVNGMLMARKMQGRLGSVGATCLGDGGTSTGAFHEAINQAAVEKLPLVMVVANNRFAYSTPTSRQFVCEDLVDKSKGYGVRGHSVDGTDLGDCLLKVGNAIDLARSGDGPQLVVASLLRLCGHGEHDDASYIPNDLKQSPCGRDCLQSAEDVILERGWGSRAGFVEMRRKILEELDAAVAKVQREPVPDPFGETWVALSSKDLLELHSNTP
ncbi:MAG: acoA 2, partial [Verrucomicrobiales bacterium]|nr:acoA 2 [Verrucomicrobiales bacterium]